MLEVLWTIVLILSLLTLLTVLLSFQFKRERKAQKLRERFFDDIHDISTNLLDINCTLRNIQNNYHNDY